MKLNSLPVILIALGFGFLLYNLRIINFSPWELLWPGFIIWVGLNQLDEAGRRRSRTDSSTQTVIGLIILAIGIYILLPIIGLNVPFIPWRLVWPIILIVIGLVKLLPGKFRFSIPFVSIDLQPSHKRSNTQSEVRSSFVGEFKRGSSDWVVEDMEISHGVGTVQLDLTQAIIPEREVFIDISGYVGEATIYLPPGLPYKAECSLNFGEITVLDINESGSGRYLASKSVDYDTATRKVNIQIHWKIGEINIHQIR